MVEIEDMADLLHFCQRILLVLRSFTIVTYEESIPDGGGKTGPLL